MADITVKGKTVKGELYVNYKDVMGVMKLHLSVFPNNSTQHLINVLEEAADELRTRKEQG